MKDGKEDIKQASMEEIKAIQAKSMEILLYFKDFCETHKLTFFIIGGCCLGAIRHKGFIPWDDDIDVFMMRDDYDKLGTLWNKYADVNRYSFCKTTETEIYHDTGASIRDNNTTFINKHSQNDDINHGLMIDIMPLDKCPKGVIAQYKQMIWGMVYSLFNAQRLPDNQGWLVRILSMIILKTVASSKMKYKIWKYAEENMKKQKNDDFSYYKELVTGFRYMKNKYPREIFDDVVYMDFDGYSLPLPKGYDQYLTMAYGDYMKLPPKEQQVPKHSTIYYNLTERYNKYKGVYYCRK